MIKDKKIIFDIVYTWVDFSNKKWKNDYQTYYNKLNNSSNYNVMNRNNSNLEELKYSLRSIDKYLKVPINKIYIVTNYGSIPTFLSLNKKIIILSDDKLLGNISFNSQAIESVLHKIPNLNDYFLYFNDDFILNNYIYIDDLINNEGKLIWYSETNFAINLNAKIKLDYFNIDCGVNNSRKYTTDIILKKNKINSINMDPIGHCLRIFNKSMIKDFINIYKNYINKLRDMMFRNDKVFCFVDGFCLHYILNNKIEYNNTKKILILVQNDNSNLIENIITYNNYYSIYFSNFYDFVCVEDMRKNKINECEYIQNFLDEKLKKKSKYEK